MLFSAIVTSEHKDSGTSFTPLAICYWRKAVVVVADTSLSTSAGPGTKSVKVTKTATFGGREFLCSCSNSLACIQSLSWDSLIRLRSSFGPATRDFLPILEVELEIKEWQFLLIGNSSTLQRKKCFWWWSHVHLIWPSFQECEGHLHPHLNGKRFNAHAQIALSFIACRIQACRIRLRSSSEDIGDTSITLNS